MQEGIDTNTARDDSRRRLLLIVILAACSWGLYLFAPRAVALMSSAESSHASEVFPWVGRFSPQDDAGFLDKISVPWIEDGTPFLCVCVALFAIYAVMLRVVKGCKAASVQGIAFGSGALFLFTQLLSPVMLSTDMFAYAFYGRVLSLHGANAYATDLRVSSDPFLILFGHQYEGSVYGPLWTLVSAVVAPIGGNHVGLVVLLFRTVAILSVLGGAALIFSIVRRHSPERAAQGLVMFLWNPLVIFETGLSGHNDATMIALALLAVWLHQRGFKACAVVSFTLSALVKFLTGMFVPLYMLMVLRGMPGWRERFLFIGRSALGVAVVVAVTTSLAKVKSDVPAAPYATAPDFYANNFHELIFKRIRRALGEDPVSVNMPIYFGGWWITVDRNTELHAAPSMQSRAVARIAKDARLFVIAPNQDDWFRVYDPLSHTKGYVADEPVSDTVDEPSGLPPDPELDRLENTPLEWPTVLKANRWIRISTWGLFALFGLLAAWKTANFERFLIWAPAALLAAYYTIMTQIWPWYSIWALALAALVPSKAPARLAMLLSGCLLTLYISIGHAGGENDWIYAYRSLAATVLPLVLFLCGLAAERLMLFSRANPDRDTLEPDGVAAAGVLNVGE